MELKAITFPSANFPAANLRVSNDTHYKFTCSSCSNSATVPFGWPLTLNTPAPSVTPAQLETIHNHFHIDAAKLKDHFEMVKCSTCDAAYVIRAHINETSQGAFQVAILGAAQVKR